MPPFLRQDSTLAPPRELPGSGPRQPAAGAEGRSDARRELCAGPFPGTARPEPAPLLRARRRPWRDAGAADPACAGAFAASAKTFVRSLPQGPARWRQRDAAPCADAAPRAQVLPRSLPLKAARCCGGSGCGSAPCRWESPLGRSLVGSECLGHHQVKSPTNVTESGDSVPRATTSLGVTCNPFPRSAPGNCPGTRAEPRVRPGEGRM